VRSTGGRPLCAKRLTALAPQLTDISTPDNAALRIHGEAAAVSPAEQLLAEALRQAVLLDQRAEHEPPSGLREEPIDLLVAGRHRGKLSAAEQQAGGHEGVDMWIPLGWPPTHWIGAATSGTPSLRSSTARKQRLTFSKAQRVRIRGACTPGGRAVARRSGS
jgi:hypothetical protein